MQPPWHLGCPAVRWRDSPVFKRTRLHLVIRTWRKTMRTPKLYMFFGCFFQETLLSRFSCFQRFSSRHGKRISSYFLITFSLSHHSIYKATCLSLHVSGNLPPKYNLKYGTNVPPLDVRKSAHLAIVISTINHSLS